MALTEFQIKVLRLLVANREEVESYFAGGAALNQILGSGRMSHDIDLFHDSAEALQATWSGDRSILLENGFIVDIIREAISFVEAEVRRGGERVLIQWVRDSAFRFFPLVNDGDFGKMLHPFDLATNKVLALAGRLEPRDWLDTIECHRQMQQLGFLVWAACGKDPGINPEMLLSEGSRHHYSQLELDMLDYVGTTPSAHSSGAEWKNAIASAKQIIEMLPEEHLGECLLSREGNLYNGPLEQIEKDLKDNTIRFHKGTIRGAWPTIVKL